VFLVNLLNAGCGSCSNDIAKIKTSIQEQSNVNTLVVSVPKDGKIDGLVITSCGKCNFGKRDKHCELSVKIGEKLFSVEGTNVHEYGDAHDSEGFCSAVRIARAKGIIKKNIFHADSFVLIAD